MFPLDLTIIAKINAIGDRVGLSCPWPLDTVENALNWISELTLDPPPEMTFAERDELRAVEDQLRGKKKAPLFHTSADVEEFFASLQRRAERARAGAAANRAKSQ